MAWAIPRFDHLVEFSGASHVGRVRKTNEDVWRADPALGLFAVADGMGGHAAGEVAARIAVDELAAGIRRPEALAALDRYVQGATVDARREVFDHLSRAAEGAHAAVVARAAADKKHSGMGCTLDAVLLVGSKGFLAHVGDSRTYLSRPTTTILLTHDHTIHGALVANGVVSPSTRPEGGTALTNAVGKKGDITVDEVLVDLHEGDRLVICSDGIHGEIDDEAIIRELSRQGTVDDTAISLINTALDRGGRDNASVVVIGIGPRRLDRTVGDRGVAARDITFAAHSTLFQGLSEPVVGRALRAAVEVEFDAGQSVPRFFAEDRVAYVVLEGQLDSPGGWTHGPSSVVYPESLARGGTVGPLCKAAVRSRALRFRGDDFREICASEQQFAAALYERLAHILARATAG